MINMQVFLKLGSFVNSSQVSTASHSELLKKCQQLYNETSFPDFFKAFEEIIKNILTTRNEDPELENIVEFTAKFVDSLWTQTNENKNETTVIVDRKNEDTVNSTVNTSLNVTTEEVGNPLFEALMKLLLNHHQANCDLVRLRCCQIIGKLLSMITNTQLFIDDESILIELQEAMIQRLKDINSNVQVQAIFAINRLQNPNDQACQIIQAFIFLMEHDPSWKVRLQALAYVGFSRKTIPYIIDRVRDMHPMVRQKAILILSEKVLIKFINIEKRIFILNSSLKDVDQTVVETCCNKLLPSWLRFKENNIIKLLKGLDVVQATDTIELMLNKMHENDCLKTLCKDFTLINKKHLINLDNLDAESVTYWRWLCEKAKVNGSDSSCIDLILPSLTEFCYYIKTVLENYKSHDFEKLESRIRAEIFYTIKQLLKMILCSDFCDTHGKNEVINLCHTLFNDNNYISLFGTLMEVFKKAVPKVDEQISCIVKIIKNKTSNDASDIHEQELANSFKLENTFHSLQLFVSLLEETEIRKMVPSLMELYNSLVISNIDCMHEDISAIAIKALNLLGMIDIKIATKHFDSFVSLLEKSKNEVLEEAFKAVINLTMTYSIDRLATDGGEKINFILASLLDHKDVHVYTFAAEGICKLFATGRLMSPKLFSKLTVMYHAFGDRNKKLNSMLSIFLPKFAFLKSQSEAQYQVSNKRHSCDTNTTIREDEPMPKIPKQN